RERGGTRSSHPGPRPRTAGPGAGAGDALPRHRDGPRAGGRHARRRRGRGGAHAGRAADGSGDDRLRRRRIESGGGPVMTTVLTLFALTLMSESSFLTQDVSTVVIGPPTKAGTSTLTGRVRIRAKTPPDVGIGVTIYKVREPS